MTSIWCAIQIPILRCAAQKHQTPKNPQVTMPICTSAQRRRLSTTSASLSCRVLLITSIFQIAYASFESSKHLTNSIVFGGLRAVPPQPPSPAPWP